MTSNDILEYLSLRYKPENINDRHKQSLGFQDRIALIITTGIGTMYAVYFFATFMVGWMLWQTFFHQQPFDPFPFAFLLFLGNIVQLLLMPLIMVGQNLQGRHAQIRADEEYKTTQSSYQDIEKILIHLNEQDKRMHQQLELITELSKSVKHQTK